MIKFKYDQPSSSDIPYALNLFFTGKCNLDCHYCFVDKTGLDHLTVDEKSLKKSISMLFDYQGNRKTISFNGGEPTLEFPLLKRIYDYAKTEAQERGIGLDVAVMTNGTLLNQPMVDYFAKNETIVKISIDGAKLSHDKNRPFKATPHVSSFDKIIKNLDAVDSSGLRLAASMVFTPKNIEYFLHNIQFLNKKKFHLIEFYPDLYARWEQKDLTKLRKIFKEFELYYTGLFQKDGRVFMNSLLSTFVNEIEINKMNYCGKIHLNVEKEFYVCDKVFSLPSRIRKKYVVGNIEEGVDDKKRSALLNKLRDGFKKTNGLMCARCSYVTYCFCPIGHYIYYLHCGDNGGNHTSQSFLRSFCSMSKIFAESFLRIKDILKHNPRFVALYQL